LSAVGASENTVRVDIEAKIESLKKIWGLTSMVESVVETNVREKIFFFVCFNCFWMCVDGHFYIYIYIGSSKY
jgi:hypothetical protein